MPYERVTAGECATYASILKESFARFGLKPPNPTSDIGQMIAALGWLGTFPPEAPQPDTAWRADQRKSLDTFVLFEQAKRTAIAVGWAFTIPGSEKVVVRLKKRLNRLQTQNEQALDYFFELDIAHRLARRGIPVAFDEPDLVIGSESLKFGLACKRPRSLRGLREQIAAAARQVTRQEFPGMVVIGLEAMLHSSGDPQKPTVTYLVDKQEQLREMVDPMIDGWLQAVEPAIEEAFAKGVWGILFCGLVTGIATKAQDGFGAVIYEWFRRPRSSPEFPDGAQMLDQMIFQPPPTSAPS